MMRSIAFMEHVYILCLTVSFTCGKLDLHKNCSEDCAEFKCLFGHCLECKEGYYHPDCLPCPETCLDRKCWQFDRCNDGCERGWYGEGCDKVCEVCPKDAQCHRKLGTCFVPTTPCPVGQCSEGCQQYCEEEEEEDTETVFSTNGILIAAFISLFLFISCFCCALKISRRNKAKEEVVQENTIEIVPLTQRRLPGTGTEDFSSSNRTFPHVSHNNTYLDPTNTILPSFMSQNPRPNPSSQVTMADISPPPRGESPPPAYSSLFGYRGNNDSGTGNIPT